MERFSNSGKRRLGALYNQDQPDSREVQAMLYPYLTFPDGTDVLYSEIKETADGPSIYVQFERPNENGFDSLRVTIPGYCWERWEGAFTDKELAKFDRFAHNHAANLFQRAAMEEADA